MPTPYFLLQPLVWSLGFALGSVMLKRALDGGAGPLRIAFLSNVAMGLMFIPGWWLVPAGLTWELLRWPLFASGLYFFGQVFTFMAMRVGDVSVIAPTFGIKVVFVAVFTVLLGAGPMPGAWWLASALSAVAVFLLGLSHWQDRARLVRTVLLAALAAALYARCDLVFQMHAREMDPMGFVAIMMTAVILESFLLVPFFRSPLRAISKEAWPWAFWGSIVIAAQSAGMAWTLGHYGEAARVNIVYSTRGLWSILLVWLAGSWFGNKESKAGVGVMTRRLVGSLLLLVAVGLVLVGGNK